MSPGDLVTIFTPDDTHFQIAYDAIERGLHVLLTKPPVKVLKEHKALIDAANRQEVLVAVEVHKRWDPIYVDARDHVSDKQIRYNDVFLIHFIIFGNITYYIDRKRSKV